MARFGIVLDVEKCTGCYACFLACKDEFVGNDYLPTSAAQPSTGQSWLRIEEIEHGSGTKVKVDYVPIMCQHCENAPCMSSDGAVYRRRDGIVIIDPVKAKGHREVVDSCPYHVIFWNEQAQLPQKCTLCAHMLDAGEKNVRCVEACPTGAMVFGDLDDPTSAVSRLINAKTRKIETLHPEFRTTPLLKYTDIPKPFVTGEVVLSDKQAVCAKGVKVTLRDREKREILATETDFFGDFQFKGLATDTEYVLQAEYDGYVARQVVVRTDVSQNVGTIMLIPY